MKSVHYNKQIGDGLYRAISVILGDRERPTPDDIEEAKDELRRFKVWLGTTDAGHGLTAEPEAAFRAREEAGVTAKMDGDAVVIRVSRKVRKEVPRG